VVKKIQDENMMIHAPILNQGDVLFWNSWTIHGSLDSQDTNRSRSSITCHAIPNKKKFLQLQTRSMELVTDSINNVNIYRPKDLANARNRLVFFVESHFPKAFYWLKSRAIVYLMKKKSH
jgi:phytanoyl-CoA hydroxylase